MELSPRFRRAVKWMIGSWLALLVIGALTLTPNGAARPQLNLIPFAVQARGLVAWWQGRTSPWALRDLVGNAVLYVPFAGCLFACLRALMPAPRAAWVTVITACAISVTIECCQLRIPGRYADITDVMMNTSGALGCVVGLAIWHAKRRNKNTIVSFYPRTTGQKSGSMKAG